MILGGLLVVVLFTALIAPWFIDWTAYRVAFQSEASRIIGQPVTVGGQAKVRLLPLPSVTFTDVSVGRQADGSPMMKADAFSMNIELMPFLQGDVRIVEMRLDRPRAIIRVNDNATVDWTSRQEFPVDPDRIQLDRLLVKNAGFVIEGLAGGRTIGGAGIDAEISAQSLVGPWRISAKGLVEGVKSEFEITTGRMQEGGSIRIKAAARRSDEPYRLLLDGPVALEDGVLTWDGAFEVDPVAAADAPDALEEALPVSASGRFEATPQRIDLPEYRLEIGDRADPYTITGSGWVTIRKAIAFELQADGRQVDLDKLQAAAGMVATDTLERRLEAVKRFADRVPVPQLDGKIDLTLPAIIAGDTVIREVTAIVRPDRDGWIVDRLDTTIPGNTQVEARGRLGIGDNFGFEGSLLVASRQPTGLANWISGRSNASLRRLKSAGLAAQVRLTPERQSFENLELVLDGVALSGRLERLAPVSGRAAILAELHGSQMDLDDLWAIYALTQEEGGGNLTNHDLDLVLNAGLLSGEGMEASGVAAHVLVKAGSISIEKLDAADFYGATIASSGRIADLLGQASGSFGLQVDAADGSRLAVLAAERLPESRLLSALASDAELTSNLSLKITIDARPSGEGATGMLSVKGRTGGTQIDFSDGFDGLPSQWASAKHDIRLQLDQPYADLLARQLSVPVIPVETPGPVRLVVNLDGVPLGRMTADLTVEAPPSNTLFAEGSLGFAEAVGTSIPDFARPNFDLQVKLGAPDADPWLMLAGFVLPGAGQGSPLSLAMNAKGAAGRYEFSGLDGQFNGSGFSGELVYDRAQAGRPKLEGNLSLDRFSLPFVFDLVTGPGRFGAPAGEDESVFGRPALAGEDADIALVAKDFDTGAGPMASGFAGRLAMSDGSISLPEFAFEWLGGSVAGSASLSNTQGNAIVHLQAQAKGLDLSRSLSLGGYASFLEGQGDLGVTLDGSGRSFGGVVANLSGSGIAGVRDAQLSGIRTDGLGDILSRTDAEGFQIEPESVGPVAREAFTGGSIHIGDLSGAFSVARGKAVLRNLRFADAGGRVEAEAEVSLASGKSEARATVTLDAGREALAAAEPAVTLRFAGVPGDIATQVETPALEGFLSLRAFEREQRRVAMLEASVLEKQRLRREIIASNVRIALREQRRQAAEREREEARRRAAEDAAFKALEAEEAERARALKDAKVEGVDKAAPDAPAGQQAPAPQQDNAKADGEPADNQADAAARQEALEAAKRARPVPRPVILPKEKTADETGGSFNLFKNLEKLLRN